jgi:hypothetical protein
MHALAEPPVSPTVIGAEERDAPPALDQRRVVVRLRDGETILVGGSPSYESALVLAQKTILKLADVGEGVAGFRTGAAGLTPGLRLVPSREPPTRDRFRSPCTGRSPAALDLRPRM